MVKRILKSYKNGGTLSDSQAEGIVKNIVNDMFLNYYYNMKKIIQDIHNYINEKEGNEITLTDDDIIKMLKEYKTKQIIETITNPSVPRPVDYKDHRIQIEHFRKQVQDWFIANPRSYYSDDPSSLGQLPSDSYIHYHMMGKLKTPDNGHGSSFKLLLEEIYEIYKKGDYKIFWY